MKLHYPSCIFLWFLSTYDQYVRVDLEPVNALTIWIPRTHGLLIATHCLVNAVDAALIGLITGKQLHHKWMVNTTTLYQKSCNTPGPSSQMVDELLWIFYLNLTWLSQCNQIRKLHTMKILLPWHACNFLIYLIITDLVTIVHVPTITVLYSSN